MALERGVKGRRYMIREHWSRAYWMLETRCRAAVAVKYCTAESVSALLIGVALFEFASYGSNLSVA